MPVTDTLVHNKERWWWWWGGEYLYPMKDAMFWNIRGLGKPEKQRDLKDMLQNLNLKILGLVDVKVVLFIVNPDDKDNMDKITSKKDRNLELAFPKIRRS